MIKKAIIIGLIAFLVYNVAFLVKDLGFHLHYYKHHPGSCRAIEKSGSEDFHVTSQGLAFITSGCAHFSMGTGYIDFMKKNNIQGRMLLYNFKDPKAGAISLKIKTSKTFKLDDFRPHGISVLEDKAKGEHLVYVVNHPFPRPDVVEKFRFNPKTNELVHLRSIADPASLRTTNDLVVVAEDRFYITNYIYYYETIWSKLEMLAQLHWGGIMYYNGTGFTDAAPHLLSPNGMFLSNDKRFLYVAFPMEQQIRVYRREDDTSLVLVQTTRVYSGVDNLHVSQDGNTLFAGAHPIGHKIVHMIEDPNNRAPSQVLQLPLKDGKILEEEATELFYDHGKLISASTVGVVYGKSLLIGSLLDTLVVCDL